MIECGTSVCQWCQKEIDGIGIATQPVTDGIEMRVFMYTECHLHSVKRSAHLFNPKLINET